MKRKFELMAIISTGITDKEIEARIKELKELLGTEIVFEEHWGMRSLAYKIKKQSKGYYVVWNFLFDADLIQDLLHSLQIAPDVLRTLLIQVPDEYKPITLKEVEEGLQIMVKEKTEKRFGGKPVLAKKTVESPGAARTEKVFEKKEVAPTATVKPESSKPVPGIEPKKEEKKKTFDQKLEDILSDADLGL